MPAIATMQIAAAKSILVMAERCLAERCLAERFIAEPVMA
jgi:hypothetical protein